MDIFRLKYLSLAIGMGAISAFAVGNLNTHSVSADDILSIELTSSPTSGTNNNPKALSVSTDIVYSISITNNSSSDIEQIVINDDIPEGLHIADNSISYYTGGNSENSKLISDGGDVTYSADGNSTAFTINKLESNSSITISVPTVVNSDTSGEKIFDNRALISSYNGTSVNIQSADTFHSYTGSADSTLPELRGGGNIPFIVIGISIMVAAAILMIVTFKRRNGKRK